MILLLILLSLLQSLATGTLSWSYSGYEAHSQELLSYKNMVITEAINSSEKCLYLFCSLSDYIYIYRCCWKQLRMSRLR